MLKLGPFSQMAASASVLSSLTRVRRMARIHWYCSGTAKNVQEKAQYCRLITRMNICASRRNLALVRKAGSVRQAGGNWNQIAATTAPTPATAACSRSLGHHSQARTLASLW